MWLDLVFLIFGGAAVWLGAEGMVRGAVKLAAYLGVPSLIIGLTIVAFGTSAPELVVSVVAAVQGHAQLSLGNVIGSNIINIGLVLGLSILIAPITVDREILKRDIPVVIIATLGVTLMAWLGSSVGRVDGLILLAGFLAYTYISYRVAVREQFRTTSMPGWKQPQLKAWHVICLIGGILVLAAGAESMVRGAVGLARSVGVSDRLIGTTIVAFGTSVPELAATLVAAKHQEGGLALGNVVGSNIYNVLLILGITATIHPIESRLTLASFDFISFVLLALILVPMIRVGGKLGRIDGSLLVLFYAMTNVMLFI